MLFGIGHFIWQRNKLSPMFAPSFQTPILQRIDVKLIAEAALFGLGWGLSGLCPGPALANIFSLNEKIFVFLAMMTFGVWVGSSLPVWFEQSTQCDSSIK